MADCFYCGLPMKDANMTNAQARELLKIGFGEHRSRKLLNYMRRTTEHLVRRADGGTWARENLTDAHMYCNSTRGDNTVDGHKEIIMAKIRGRSHPLSCLLPIEDSYGSP